MRTVVDLRNEDEYGDDAAPRPDTVRTLRVPLDGVDDKEFWDRWASGPQFGTPLYYAPHLERMPERSVAVLQAIAHAPPGGVLFHCMAADRTGQIAMLLLDLLEVPAGVIADDYGLTPPDDGTEAFLAAEGTTRPRSSPRRCATPARG